MVVVGLEKLKDGGANLLVLDPKYHNVDLNSSLHARRPRPGQIDQWLALYRRGASYFRTHSEFELLT